MRLKFVHVLLGIYLLLFLGLAINPIDRATWITENLTVVLVVLFLALTYNKFVFSNFSYGMMFIWVVLHTIGGHYTFEFVPFDFITNLFDFSRNNFDRFAHFSIGFFAYPIAEFFMRKKAFKYNWMLYIMPVLILLSIAGFYEITEWIYAALSNPELGVAFLGSQGDIWDAQKDMLMDTCGAVFAIIVFWIRKRFK